MADDSDIFDSILVNSGLAPAKDAWQKDFVRAVNKSASELGVNAKDLALAMSYETGGTFDSSMRGGDTGKRVGLIQAGDQEMKDYGISPDQTPAQQMEGVTKYLKARGLQPGMGLEDIYSTINAGKPGKYDASDKPGENVLSHVARMSDPNDYRNQAAERLFQGEKPVAAADDDSWADGIELPKPPLVDGAEREMSAIAGQPFSGPTWNNYLDISNKLLLGGGKPILAATQAGKQALAEMNAGRPIGEAIANMPETYSQARDAYTQAHEQWAQENPGADARNMILAPLVPTVALLAATKGKATPLLEEGLASMSPRYGPQVAKFLTGAAGEGGSGIPNFLLKSASRAASGAAEGGMAGALQSGLTNNSIGDNVALGAELGGIISPVVGALAPSVRGLFNAAISKPIATIASKAAGLGIDLKAPQLTTRFSGFLPKVVKEAGDEQLSQYGRALSKEFGEDTPELTRDVVQKAKGRIGNDFETFAQGVQNNIGDVPLLKGLSQTRADVFNMSGDVKNPDYIAAKHWIGIIGRAAQNGLLDGETFRSITKRGSPFMSAFVDSDNPNKRMIGNKIYGLLQDALVRNAPAAVVDKLKTARQQWSALKQLEPVIEKSWPSGVVNPQSMASLKGSNTGNLNDLAEIGQLLPKTAKTGEAKAPGGDEGILGFLHKLPKSLQFGGTAAGGAYAAHAGIEPAMNMISSNPTLAVGAALTGAAGGAGLVMNKYVQKLMLDPRFRDILVAKGLGQGAGEMPLSAAAMSAAQEQAPTVLGTELYEGGE